VSTFDRFARNYNEGHEKAVRATGYSPAFFHEYKVLEVAARLEREGFASRGFKLLNYGCGVGECDRFLRRHLPAARILGVDVSAESIAVARESNQDLPDLSYCHLDGSSVPSDGKFEVAFIANVLHHVRRDLRPGVLASIRDTLAPGGLLFVFELNPYNPGTQWIAYQNDYKFDKDASLLRPGLTTRLLADTGFVPEAPRHHIFFPGQLSRLRGLEKHMEKLPLGAHYSVVARVP
jgi:SAM-dependent methyltransferase